MERIKVTHAGSLIRPQELLAFLSAVDHGRASTDSVEYEAALAKAVAYAVRRQVETGVDIIDDGEMGKSTWITYLYERTSGLEARPLAGNFSSILPASRDRQNFPGAYRELDMLEHDATIRIRAEASGPEPAAREEGPRAPSGAVSWVCTGPMTYDRTAIDRDLVNFKVALEGSSKDISETFMPVVAPASAYWLVCFGSWHGPHAYDPPLRDSVDLVLAVNAKYYLMEQANPRHEHEWRIWEDVPLPDGKVLVPGVVTHHTNVVEHPELVAQRLVRLADVVGRERVMGGTDCGFAQGAFMHRVHEEIQWAKLASLVEGARIASRELWGAKADV